MRPIRLSVLDRSSVRTDRSRDAAIRDTVHFAKQIEALGYHRFWVSEHHSVPGVAGSAPTVLAMAAADATEHIRIGTGGVMLPNHQPLVVAEQFGVLAAMHPHRVDLGIGRSLGFTGGVRAALGAERKDPERFTEQLTELLGYFGGNGTRHPGVHAYPGEHASLPTFLLATGSGAELAARFGLALVIAPIHGMTAMRERIEAYRAAFTASAERTEPKVIVSTAIAVAERTEEARELLLPEAWSSAYARSNGEFPPLEPADSVLARSWTAKQRANIEATLHTQIYGTQTEVAEQLEDLVDRTGADELLVTMSTYDRSAMLDSYARLTETVPTAMS